MILSQAGGTTGYDALLHEPDGRDKAVEPGYERPQVGPTTNFVGNHMTQGAIDMVQMQLQRCKPRPQLLEGGACLLRLTAAAAPQAADADDARCGADAKQLCQDCMALLTVLTERSKVTTCDEWAGAGCQRRVGRQILQRCEVP